MFCAVRIIPFVDVILDVFVKMLGVVGAPVAWMNE